MADVATAILLGIVEGVTEFLPVSSTGHLILAGKLLGFDAEHWKVFNIVIQFGAILAVVVLYWWRFWEAGLGLLRRERSAIRFFRNILLAFLPAAVIGLVLIKKIDALLGEPTVAAVVVAVMLILGGVAIILIERMPRRHDTFSVEAMSWKVALGIGVVQCLAMIPGVSRSGATIMGALLLGVERKTAAEFSFFLAIPTMLGATSLELFKHRHDIAAGGAGGATDIAIGFVVAFIVALVVVRAFVTLVSRHGFKPFAWYRIVVGLVALVWLGLK
jgi:undecaprenyl-diphosphatase